jgi:putative ABC transport system substrate-binding protein
MRRVGVITGTRAEDPETNARHAAFEQALQQLGWSKGGNVRIDYRFAGGDAAISRRQAEDLVALAPTSLCPLAAFRQERSFGRLTQCRSCS